jgi:hypothetical protein
MHKPPRVLVGAVVLSAIVSGRLECIAVKRGAREHTRRDDRAVLGPTSVEGAHE